MARAERKKEKMDIRAAIVPGGIRDGKSATGGRSDRTYLIHILDLIART